MLQVRGIIKSLDENSAQPPVNVLYFLLEIKDVLLKLLWEGKTASREAAGWHRESTCKPPDPETSPLFLFNMN